MCFENSTSAKISPGKVSLIKFLYFHFFIIFIIYIFIYINRSYDATIYIRRIYKLPEISNNTWKKS